MPGDFNNKSTYQSEILYGLEKLISWPLSLPSSNKKKIFPVLGKRTQSTWQVDSIFLVMSLYSNVYGDWTDKKKKINNYSPWVHNL